MRVKTLIDSLLLACCWGPSYLFIKIAVEEVPPLVMATWRVVVGGLLLWVMMRVRGIKLPPLGPVWINLAIMGFLGCGVPWTLFAVGEQYIPSAMAAMINGVVPLAVALLAHFLLADERLNSRTIGALCLGFTGLMLLIGSTLLDGEFGADTVGILYVVGACTGYAAGIVFARWRLQGLPPLVAPGCQLMTAAVWMVPLTFFAEPEYFSNFQLPSFATMGALTYLAIPGSALAFLFYFRIIERSGATATGIVIYLLPVVGVLLGVFLNGERLTYVQYLGFVAIISGMLAANGLFRLPRRWRAERRALA